MEPFHAWPLTPLHFIKIAASLVAVGANLICTRWVFQRRRTPRRLLS